MLPAARPLSPNSYWLSAAPTSRGADRGSEFDYHESRAVALALDRREYPVVCHLHELKDGAYIKVDPGQLNQLILNLAVNARDAMRAGGTLTLETSTARSTTIPGLRASPKILRAGDYVLINMADTGVGMSDEVKAHVFEPFFTTKGKAREPVWASPPVTELFGKAAAISGLKASWAKARP